MNEERASTWAWCVCIMLLLATMLNYMDRQALSVILPTLKAEYNLTESRVGMIEGCFGFAFAFGSLLFGWLADRWGPRYLYPAILTGWSLAGVATAAAGQPEWMAMLESSTDEPGTGVYYWLLGCRIALGLFEAGHWPCALLTVRAILTAKDRTLGNGILQSGASLGAVGVPIYIELADRAGQSWEFAFWSIGIGGLMWVPAWFILIGGHELKRPKVEPTSTPVMQEPLSVLLRKLFVLAIVICTLVISWQFLRAWLGLFLQDYHGYSKQMTRGLMSGYFIVADVGCLLAGVFVTRMVAGGFSLDAARKWGYLIFGLLSACIALIPQAGSGPLMVALLFIGAAGILGLHPFYYSLAQEISATRMGLLSGGLAALGWVVGSVAQIWLGAHIEATQSYQLGFLIVGLVPLIGLIALLFFWPRQRSPLA